MRPSPNLTHVLHIGFSPNWTTATFVPTPQKPVLAKSDGSIPEIWQHMFMLFCFFLHFISYFSILPPNRSSNSSVRCGCSSKPFKVHLGFIALKAEQHPSKPIYTSKKNSKQIITNNEIPSSSVVTTGIRCTMPPASGPLGLSRPGTQ